MMLGPKRWYEVAAEQDSDEPPKHIDRPMTKDERHKWEDPRPDFKWPVAVSHPIEAGAEKVWDVISMPGNLELCHPFCEKNPVKAWPGAEAQDEIYYLSEWIYKRRFCRWIDEVGYDLNIGRAGGRTSFVSWRIRSINDQNCILSIAVYPHVLQDVPLMIRWLPHVAYIAPMLRRYLSSVVRGFEWYVIRGEPVPRNQFGTHPWFSSS